MSLRAVEMQVSIPRSQNVGKIQDQLQQRAQVAQDHISMEQNKEDEKKRKQVYETTECDPKRIHNDEESGNKSMYVENGQKQKNDNQDLEFAKHPFKGNFVDLSC
ncbi:hypothetical protein BKP45_20080 [Anaerobacillus alkalidiazotrophicus]|uniref:RNA polymerase subunit sigma n=1 Tax=Anaerobacillus alkalidiazotrophicus TaxID=472963 RepID=A0A1S2LZG4_9BACI|nr:hypothetical protein [Anaerobacillus alkalidiazotrophicus]OIJ17861.1 hypothetical protein BKP45_20080 [Anaerobacillus alkalidiazotrophicus]